MLLFSQEKMVGARGFEPPTPSPPDCLQTRTDIAILVKEGPKALVYQSHLMSDLDMKVQALPYS